MGIDGCHLDVIPEVPGPVVQPGGHRGCAAVLDHVEQHVAVDVDQLGGVDGVVIRPRRQHLVLVDAQGPDPVEPAGIIDEGSHSEAPGDGGHALGLLADQPADLPGRPAGEAPLDEVASLGEGPGRTVGIRAEPSALPPHQPHRPATDREIPNLDLAPPVADGPYSAVLAAHHLGRRLDEEPQLVVALRRRQHNEAVHSQQRTRATTTVIHAPCPPFSLAW